MWLTPFFYFSLCLLLLGTVNGAARVYLSSINKDTPRLVADEEMAAVHHKDPRSSLRHRPPQF